MNVKKEIHNKLASINDNIISNLIFTFIKENNISYSENKNGIFFNVSLLTDKLAIKLLNFIETITTNNNTTEIDNIIIPKKEISQYKKKKEKVIYKDYEIDKQLKDAKVANRSMVMAGLFKPIQINTDLLNLALTETDTKAAQPIPLGELFSTQAEVTGQGLQGQFIKPGVQSTSPSATRASDVLRQEELNKILTGTP